MPANQKAAAEIAEVPHVTAAPCGAAASPGKQRVVTGKPKSRISVAHWRIRFANRTQDLT
jgi:hypothetical protein